MPLREFTDSRGATWRVWATQPLSENVRPDLRGGWLTFEQGTLRRRLAPIPEGWAELPEEGLRRLCTQATPQRERRRLAE